MSSSYYDDFLSKVSSSPEWSQSDERTVLEPHAYVSSMPGKDIRGKMIEAFNLWLHVPEETLTTIAKVVGMLHNASLLVDDVEDDSQLRRGIPVAHKIYGVPQTINSANYVYFLAYQELFKLRERDRQSGDIPPKVELDRMVTEELMNLHRGQGLDLFWRDTLTCPTEEQYIAMVNNKTGGLFRLAIKLMMAKSTSDVDYVPLVNLIGVYFQIRDDYMNLQSSEYTDNKGYCEDLTEGKFSFPIVHSVRADTSNRQILNVLSKRPGTPTMKRYAVNYMRDRTASFEYTRGVLDKLDKQARAEVARLGGNPKLEAILDALQVKD
ncbi:geranylgeranyl pyrophosphate synthetase [Tulasnella sp. UAMH 9824]|nr:geranylgeranyl pyrophosphate synthetase [Tulasnella sp. UAMH 9824]